MIIITGGAGFIGSAFARKCNLMGIKDILIVDNLADSEKWRNLVHVEYSEYLHKDDFLSMVMDNLVPNSVTAIVHMGACSSTTETNMDYLMDNNYRYTRALADWCARRDVRFIYASSAATYGKGENGFDDDHENIEGLKPINRYGYSKQLFDLHALKYDQLKNVVGLKFFNVFGPNEYHKEGMRSVICKAYADVVKKGEMSLFKSYHPDYKDGEQKRDFIYIKDCVNILWWLYKNPQINGIYNVGTGEARSWNDVANALFAATGKPANINYIDMPSDVRAHYQYFTQANVTKLKRLKCPVKFTSLEDAIKDYVKYLKTEAAL